IEANVGRNVDLRLGEKETIRGKIVGIAQARPVALPLEETSRSLYGFNAAPPAEAPTLVLLETSNGTTAISRTAVQEISSESGPLKTAFERKKRSAALRLRAENPQSNGRIVVQYLAKGITWAPSCAIDITDPRKARVTTKAEIIDEVEDLDDVPVSFVTGF